MTSRSPNPSNLRAYFFLTALFHLAAIVSAFPEVEARLPPSLPALILWAHAPLLLIGGYLQERLSSSQSGPLWMRLDGSVRLSFALAVSYLFVVISRAYQISLGPADPLGAPGKELNDRILWYGIWSVGLLSLGPVALLVRGLMLLVFPVRRAPPWLALLLLLGAGLGLGFAALTFLPKLPKLQ